MMASNERVHNNAPRNIPATHTNSVRLPTRTTREINPTNGNAITLFIINDICFYLYVSLYRI